MCRFVFRHKLTPNVKGLAKAGASYLFIHLSVGSPLLLEHNAQ